MSFTTWSFACFMAIVFLIYWTLPSRVSKNWILAGSGLFYFAYAYPPFLPLLFILTMMTWMVSLKSYAKFWSLLLCSCILVLAWFKYREFLGELFRGNGKVLYEKNLLMGFVPLGISFFTFEFIHYLVDVRFKKASPAPLGSYFSFIFFFPSLVSGPIKRWQLFQEQLLQKVQSIQSLPWTEASWRIVRGLFKKFVLADTFALGATALGDPSHADAEHLWRSTFAYAGQILFDFSGYSDLAIGCGLLLGIRLPENFNFPYGRKNISDFWKYWHMSLSSWIRDYLFIPLGGSRVVRWRIAVNLTVVMILCGLWHGAGLNFIAWGFWHGIGLVVWHSFHHFRQKTRPWPLAWIWSFLSRVLTFLFVCIGWVFFAAPSLKDAGIALSKMFNF